jgi:diguanylate cyclase
MQRLGDLTRGAKRGMSKNSVITLDIRRRTRDADLAAIDGLLDGMMGLLRDLLLADDDAGRGPLAERIETCRTALVGGVPPSDLSELSAACLAEGRDVVAATAQQRLQRVQDSVALVAALREVMATIGSEMSSMHTSISQSTERFEAIGLLSNPQQIKARLVAEVLTLKQIAVKRRRTWEETAKALVQRVETLEHDLSNVRSEATTDQLTGVANRRGFDQTCERWVRTSRSAFVMAILDVDDFKSVNDLKGHAAGDELLRHVARQLARCFRESDVVARVGGDEFAVLAADLTLAQAERRIAGVLTQLAAGVSDGDGVAQQATLSCGIAEFSAGDTPASLYERADEAQYAAKKQGKNRVVAKARPLIRDLNRR